MRIGLDGFPLAAPKTGVGHYTFELVRALSAISPDDRFELVSPLPFSDEVAAEVDLIPNLELVRRRTNLITRRWWGVGLPRYVRKAGLDLFHGTNYEVPLLSRKRSVLTIHDLSVFLHSDKHETRIAQRARRRLPVMLRSAGMIITATQVVKKEICGRFKVDPDRIAVTPYAPRSVFRPSSVDECLRTWERLGIDRRFILFAGTIEPRKNLVTLVRAFDKLLRQTSHRPQLVIAGGKGWLSDDLHQLIERLDLSDRLIFTGYVDDEDLRALYSSCQVFVYPSLYEGFGLPPFEAMACGAAVIAGDIPVLRETLGDNACLVDPIDVEALAKAIVGILEEKSRREQMSTRGRVYASQFTWEGTARKTLEVYERVIARQRQSTRNRSRLNG